MILNEDAVCALGETGESPCVYLLIKNISHYDAYFFFEWRRDQGPVFTDHDDDG